MELYFILPRNEGQELNYIETFKGNLVKATERAEKMQKDLKKALPQATITVEVQSGRTLKKLAEII